MSRWQLALLASVFGLGLRALVGQGPYSGMGVVPMHGDFEAQRHWMEITKHLPVREWYSGTHELNDLGYWGLDYPPLTAYHSWLFGEWFHLAHPPMVELGKSRGREDFLTKTWMRFSALLSDAAVFFPSVLWFAWCSRGNTTAYQPKQWFAYLTMVFASPSLILVDHGHFQFNCVCHGLVVFALAFALKSGPGRLTNRDAALTCVFFSLALNFKQMALYYALAFFVYLLRWGVDSVWTRLPLLALAVLATFLVVWGPFLWSSTHLQVLHRVFPFERGIFEDKVANFWGVSNLVVKWKLVCSAGQLKLLSLGLTLSSCLLPLARLWRSPDLLLSAMFCVSLGFFLFAFQVHEKSILLPLIPALLVRTETNAFAVGFSLACSFSLFPLFVKDGIAFTALVLNAVYVLLAWLVMELSPQEWRLLGAMCLGFVCLSALLVGAESPFPSLPDLFVVVHNAYSFLVFVGFALYGNAVLLFPASLPRGVAKSKGE